MTSRLDPATLDKVYQKLLELLTLSKEHTENLTTRGLSTANITKNGYRSLARAGRTEIAQKLVDAFGEEICSQIPGLYKNGNVWRLAGNSGMLIPVRTALGLIQALKIRADNATGSKRYTILSSKYYKGKSPGAPIHVPLKAQGEWALCRITEGELKADIATLISGIPTISIPGAQTWRDVIPFLKNVQGVKTVRIAFDMDAHTNRDVAQAIYNLYSTLKSENFIVEIETWDSKYKGIDDALLANTKITTLTGNDAYTWIQNICPEIKLSADRGQGEDASTGNNESSDKEPDDKTKFPRLASFAKVCSTMQYFLECVLNGEHLTHKERFSLVHIAKNIGISESEAVDFFRNQKNFDEMKTRRHVESIFKLEKLPSCKRLGENFNKCSGTCEAKQASGGWSPVHVASVQHDRPLPTIIFNHRQMRDILNDAWKAVIDNNQPEPKLFNCESRVIRLFRRASDKPLEIQTMDGTTMHGHLIRIANWYKQTKKDKLPDSPEIRISKDMLRCAPTSLPKLDAVVTSPLYDSNGEIITEPGYHSRERLYVDGLRLLDVPEVPLNPTCAQVEAAKQLLFGELLRDFPFSRESDKAHALSMFLQIPARRLICGSTPLYGVESPGPGSGKGLLLKCLAAISMGRIPAFHTLPRTEEEIRKKILSELMNGPEMFIFDNIPTDYLVNSDTLASVLTSDPFSDRLLGASKIITVPNKCLWALTGNNPKLHTDLIRRYIPIRLDPKMDKAWERNGFHHSLPQWALDNREKLMHAILVFIQFWIAKKRPKPNKLVPALGSFEEWRDVIGGILEVIEVPGFLADRDDVYEAADVDGQEWREFIQMWHKTFSSSPKPPRELNDFCNKHKLMNRVRGNGNEQSQLTFLGNALRDARDRVFGGLRLTLERENGKSHHSKRYFLGSISNKKTHMVAEQICGNHESGRGEPVQEPPLGPPAKTIEETKTYIDSGSLGSLTPNYREKNKEEVNNSTVVITTSENNSLCDDPREGSLGPHNFVTNENSNGKHGESSGEPLIGAMPQEDFDAI